MIWWDNCWMGPSFSSSIFLFHFEFVFFWLSYFALIPLFVISTVYFMEDAVSVVIGYNLIIIMVPCSISIVYGSAYKHDFFGDFGGWMYKSIYKIFAQWALLFSWNLNIIKIVNLWWTYLSSIVNELNIWEI